jgi:hypothetical protein
MDLANMREQGVHHLIADPLPSGVNRQHLQAKETVAIFPLASVR